VVNGQIAGGASTVVTIIDDESEGIIEFDVPEEEVSEGDGALEFSLHRSSESIGEVTVRVQAQGGSAVADEDFETFDSLFTFGYNDTESKAIQINVLQDSIVEGSETFTLQITEITGAEIGTVEPITITIDDDDSHGTIQFASSSFTTTRNAGKFRVQVLRQNGSLGNVSVDFATAPGSAQPGVDYSNTFVTLEFLEGDTAKFVEIDIINYESEETKSFEIVLRNAIGGVTLGRAIATVNINPPGEVANVATVSASFVDSSHVRLQISNYQFIDIKDPPDDPFGVGADSIMIWYSDTGYPQQPSLSDPNRFSWAISEMIDQQGFVFVDTVEVPKLTGPGDSFYYFSISTQYYNPQLIIPEFNQQQGDSVLMADNTPPLNPLRVRGLFDTQAPTDSAVLRITNISNLDMNKVSSVAYQISYDSANYSEPNIYGTLSRQQLLDANDTITVNISLPGFKTDPKKVFVRVTVLGVNQLKSQFVRTSFFVGADINLNTLSVIATAPTSSTVDVAWSGDVSNYTNLRLIYSEDPIPLGLELPPFDNEVLLQASATSYTISGLTFSQTYYVTVLGQTSAGNWTKATASSTDTATTKAPSDTTKPDNTIQIITASFNPETSKLDVTFEIENDRELLYNYIIADTPEALTSEPVFTNTWNAVLGEQVEASINLNQRLLFGTTQYIGLVVKTENSVQSDVTAAATAEFTIPQFGPGLKQELVYFPQGVNTISLFNGKVMLTKPTGWSGGVDVSTKVQVVDLPRTINGIFAVSQAISFSSRNEPHKVPVALQVTAPQLPSGTSLSDVKMYRYNEVEKLEVIYESQPDAALGQGYIKASFSDLTNTFFLGVDLVSPQIDVTIDESFDTAQPLSSFENINFEYSIDELVSNPTVTLTVYSPAGGVARTQKVLQATEQGVFQESISGSNIAAQAGIFIWLEAFDGKNRQTINLSRNLSFKETIEIPPEQWKPIVISGEAPQTSPQSVLKTISQTEPWQYDPLHFRLFVYGATSASTHGWIEYNAAIANNFAFTPGKVIWLKSRNGHFVEIDNVVSPSLRNPVSFTIGNAQWLDVVSPFNFPISLADIFTASGPESHSFFSIWKWVQGGNGQWVLQTMYQPALQQGVDPSLTQSTHINASDILAIYNNSFMPQQFTIPPMPVALSQSHNGLGKSSSIASTSGANSVVIRSKQTAMFSDALYGVSPSLTKDFVISKVPSLSSWEVVLSDDSYANSSLIMQKSNEKFFTFTAHFKKKDKQQQSSDVAFSADLLSPSHSEAKLHLFKAATGQEVKTNNTNAFSAKDGEYITVVYGDQAYVSEYKMQAARPIEVLWRGVHVGAQTLQFTFSNASTQLRGNIRFVALNGRTTYERKFVGNAIQLVHPPLSAGVYFIVIEAKDPVTHKLVSFTTRMVQM